MRQVGLDTADLRRLTPADESGAAQEEALAAVAGWRRLRGNDHPRADARVRLGRRVATREAGRNDCDADL